MDQIRWADSAAVSQPLPGVYHIEAQPGIFVTLLTGRRRSLLVDTGLGLGDLRRTVEGLAEGPLTVVNTHGHIDHFGGNYQFGQVYIRAGEMETARDSLAPLHLENLAPDQPILDGRDPRSWGAAEWYDRSFAHARDLPDGMVFDLGGLTVMPVPLPSHTPGMTGFYVEERGLLLGGDSVCTLVNLCLPGASSVEEHLRVLLAAGEIPFTHLLTSHSERLLGRGDFDGFVACARAYDGQKAARYRDPLYPDIAGRMFIHDDGQGHTGIIVSRQKF